MDIIDIKYMVKPLNFISKTANLKPGMVCINWTLVILAIRRSSDV
jgi:hypothetical protein